MKQKYIHFTNLKDAKSIFNSKQLWQSSFGPMGSVFAVAVGGAFVPSVQLSKLGRAPQKEIAIIFESDLLPDVTFPEEVMWHVDVLPIKNIKPISLKKAKDLLNDSVPVDENFDMLKMPNHPAFNDGGKWTRMPENFKPWVPGKDNKKYITASNLWAKTKNLDKLSKFWNENKSLTELKFKIIIKNLILEVFQ